MGGCFSCYRRSGEGTPLLSRNWEAFQAAKKGDLQGLKERLRISGAKIFQEVDDEEQNVLHISAGVGSLQCVSWLIQECKFSPDQQDRQGWSPLHHASFGGHESVVTFLVNDAECDLSLKDRKGNLSLHVASEIGHLGVIKIICRVDNSLIGSKNRKGQTPLQLAVIRNRVEVVQWILDEGKVNVNASDSERNTALHYACEGSNTAMVEMLIESGARIEVKNYYGQSPINKASPANRELLIERRYVELANRVKKVGILDVHGNELSNQQLNDLWNRLHLYVPVREYLTELRVFNNNLTEFPEWLKEVPNIQEIYIAHNSIKIIPHWLGTLVTLKKLDLDFLSTPPNLTDSDEESGVRSRENSEESLDVTAPIGHLTTRPPSPRRSAKYPIHDELVIPDSIGNLVNIETLSMTDNGIEVIPNSIGSLTKLDSLNLKGNRIRVLPDSICNCSSLRELSLEKNQLTTVPTGMGRLTKLELINIDRNPIKYFPSNLEHNVIFKWLADLKGVPFQ